MSSPTALWLLAVVLVIATICIISCGIPGLNGAPVSLLNR